LKSSTPTSSLGQARTEIVYRNPSTGDPSVETSRKSTSGSLLTRETQVYDHFARPIRNIQRRPSGNSSYTETEQKTFYNALSWVTKVTTRQNKSSVNTNWSTRYDQYDAFGRPGRVIAPDNWTETRGYSGVRVETSSKSVRTSLSGNTSVTTTTVKDSRGRATRVVNPLYETKATYDPYDVRISAQRIGGGINQTRSYTYDARGLLVSERHPEIGNSGNGWVTYKPDAFGKRRRLSDHGRNLTYVYDNAGRLTLIKNTSGGKKWREWAWASSNSGSNYQKGKVKREIRHNYPGGGTDDWAIYEEYEYRGKLGKVSKKTTQLQFPHLSGDDRYDVFFSQTFAYDQLGNPTSYGYPKCETTPQNLRRQCDDGPNDVLAPDHNVSVTYNQGRTRKVTSSLGPWGQYDYHHNLQMSRLDYSNNVDGIFDQGTNGMARPRRLQYKKGSAQRFDTGTFSYDGAGNIWAIGNDRYYYDRASRLLYGTVSQAGSGFREEYTYDDADNMTSYNRNGWGWQSQAVHSSSNRMRGGSNDIVYDGAGNMTSIGVGGLYVMQYDELNQQVQFDNNISGQQSIHLYAFGPGEKRLIAFEAGVGERTFKFRDLQGRVLREYKVNGWGDYVSPSQQGAAWVFEKDYIHGPSGLIATRARSGAKRFFHQDHLGSTRAITDESGVRVGFRHFYPFGVGASTSTGEDEPTVKFTGHERDPHNLTDYMMARTYLFPFGRFASVDPARDGWNLYTYVGNNPIGYVDPNGETAAVAGWELLAAAAPKIPAPPPVAVAAAVGVGAGLLIGEIPVGGGQNVNDVVSDLLATVLTLDLAAPMESRRRPTTAPGNRPPPPTAIPGARPRTTPPPDLRPGDPDDPKQPPGGEKLGELGVDSRKKTIIDNLVDGLDTILGALGG
ncbi:MAG: RHS repeat-associated core domain-containing protein, partial [bacterium]|nr:RHS repeat-associated core domain-containing protein [bacterium]